MLTGSELRQLRAADRKRLVAITAALQPLARDAEAAAACHADSTRMLAADRLGLDDYACDTATAAECDAVWSSADVIRARHIYDALRDARELLQYARSLIDTADGDLRD